MPFEPVKPNSRDYLLGPFLADGHSIVRWLPQGQERSADGRLLPESDFEWALGKRVELKRTINLQTIKDYVKAGLKRNKAVFMIDFGSRHPKSRVLRGLQTFTPQAGEPEIWGYWNGTLVRLQ
ncbi:MAG: hypothetical protein ACOX61_06310 [Brooklawnia sp.]|jgi:hypothetical protein